MRVKNETQATAFLPNQWLQGISLQGPDFAICLHGCLHATEAQWEAKGNHENRVCLVR